MNKIFYGFLVFYIVYTLLMLSRVVFQAEHSTDGIQLAKLQKEADDIRVQNDLLKEQIADQMSLRVIEAKARAMGFVPLDDAHIVYLR